MDKIGKVTAKTHRHRVKVYMDDIDITSSCYEADDIDGYALVREINADGLLVRDGNGKIPPLSRRTGNVRIEWISR